MEQGNNASLAGRTALVTGGGQGLGLGIVKVLSMAGANVVINDVVQERAASAAAAIDGSRGSKAVGAAGDVSSLADVRRIVQSAHDAFGRIDILVNNAAIFCNKPF